MPEIVNPVGTVILTEVTVPTVESALEIVKFGYVPVMVVVPPPVSDTTWSGDVFTTLIFPLLVIGPPLTEMPVPAVKFTEVTVPLNWSLAVMVKLG